MQRPTFVRMPTVSVATLSLPPMYAWPMPVKRAIIGVCFILCLMAYATMAAGIIGLTTLVLGLL
jgi:hypothetical protein